MGILERMRLDGKTTFITGGARGIGKAIATAIAEAGSNVVIVDVDIEEANKVVAELEAATGVGTIAIQTDVTNQEDINNMIKTIIDKFGRIDVAFCNAGICMNIPAEEMTLDQFKR